MLMESMGDGNAWAAFDLTITYPRASERGKDRAAQRLASPPMLLFS